MVKGFYPLKRRSGSLIQIILKILESTWLKFAHNTICIEERESYFYSSEFSTFIDVST